MVAALLTVHYLRNYNYRVHLSKRRARGGAGGVQSAVSQLVVKHRELNENEKKAEVRITRENHDFHVATLRKSTQ